MNSFCSSIAGDTNNQQLLLNITPGFIEPKHFLTVFKANNKLILQITPPPLNSPFAPLPFAFFP